MNLEEQLRAVLSQEAEMRTTPTPDIDGMVNGGETRLRRRNSMRIGLAAAAVLLVGGGVYGATQLGDDGDPDSSVANQPSEPAPAEPVIPVADEHVPMEAGTYTIPSDEYSAVEYTVDIPEGWTAQYGRSFGKGEGTDGDPFVSFGTAITDDVHVNADSCRGAGDGGGARMKVGPGVADLVAALGRQKGPRVSAPVQTTLGGYPATRLDLRVPLKSLPEQGCTLAPDWLQIWYNPTADDYFVVPPNAVASVYVLDVDGHRQVFQTHTRSPASQQDRAELQSVLDSISILPSDES